jgi:hypothetical protein
MVLLKKLQKPEISAEEIELIRNTEELMESTSYGTRTTINAVLAPLVRLASRFHFVQPIKNPTAGVARIFRTEME